MTEDVAVECSLVLRHDDFIMQNHRVHDVSVLPGVTFLDIIWRIMIQRGLEHHRAVLRDVVFPEPITTTPDLDRGIRITIGGTSPGAGQVTGESRYLRAGVPASAWHQNIRAAVTFTDEPGPPPIDVAALIAAALRQGDMSDMYARTLSRQIRHGAVMKGLGPLHVGDRWLLAELRLDPASPPAGRFHLHPALLDAATIAMYGQTEASAAEPFIPLVIERFRAVKPLPGRCYLYAPRPEVLAASGEIITNDGLLYDADGQFVAEIGALACKRIRSADLISRLVARPQAAPPEAAPPRLGVPAGAVPSAGAHNGAGYGNGDGGLTGITNAYIRVLRDMMGRHLGGPASQVPTGQGFYDLGLDSVAMLRISQELQEVTGARLYPTLLFEFTDIDGLARHLAQAYGPPASMLPPDAAAPGRENGVARTPAASAPAPQITVDAGPPVALPPTVAGGLVRCYRPVWSELPLAAPEPAPGGLVVFGGGERVTAELRRLAPAGRWVVSVQPGKEFARTGQDTYRLDLAGRGQLAELIALLASERGTPAAFAYFVPADAGQAAGDQAAGGEPAWADAATACTVVRSLAGALIDSRPAAPVTLCVISAGEQDAPQHAALAALGRTMTAETPVLRCRSVQLEGRPGPAFVARVLAGEVRDTAAESQVRYDGGRRYTRRYEPLPAVTAARPEGVLRAGGVYVLTGGAGELAGLLAEELGRRWHARLVLIGRRPLDERLRARMDRWNSYSARTEYLQADVAREDEVTAALDSARQRFGRIDGIFHCAGSVRDGLFFRKPAADVAEVLAAKLRGTVNLDAATKDDDLDVFVLFSSLAASVPNPGQSEYAFANAFLEHFADWRSRRPDRAGRSLAVGWPLWEKGGMAVPPQMVAAARAVNGWRPLPAEDGMGALLGALAGADARVIVTYGEADRTDAALPREPAPRGAAPCGPAGQDDLKIAIIGVAGQYPGAADVREFWRNLAAGRDCVTEIPAERWRHERYFDAEPGHDGRTYSRWGGFLDGVDKFDPSFFGISRREAERMDPQERLFLTTCWRTLEDAGYAAADLAGAPVGVFAGVMWNHYQLYEADGVAPAAMHAAVPNRVSYTLDFTGPSMAVDTACSSSLIALHLAAESLRRGECSMAVAGGVNVTVHPQKYLQLAQGRFLSADGRCHSFGRDATGYVPGEGVGAVLLKRLEQARADGDHIYAVIAGSSVNHTGRTSGFTVPSAASQAALIRTALGGIDAATVGYIEAHGTGTSLGDPIEIEGLRQAFGDAALPPGRCAVGSVKSNIGHLESAAGIAGITKVLLQFEHGCLVPSLHAAEPNPHIDFHASAFAVQRELTRWPEPAAGTPRRAGVSAFGAGGANAHVVLERAADEPGPCAADDPPFLFVLSAADDQTLRHYAAAFTGFLAGDRTAARLPSGSPVPGTDLGPVESASGVQATAVAAAARRLGVPAAEIDPAGSLSDLGLDAADLAGLRAELAERWPAVADRLSLDDRIDALTGAASSEPAISLADLTYTLQTGRNAMATRMALVVSDLAALQAGLRRYLAGEPPGDGGFWAADAGPAHDGTGLFAAGRLADAAAAWVAGATVRWRSCYPRPGRRRPRRVPLPGYPFNEQSCWIGQWKAEARTMPPVPLEPPEPSGVEMSVVEHGIALVRLTAGTTGNMLGRELVSGLKRAFAEIADRPEVTAVVVTGGDRVFSMGAAPEGLAELAARRGRFTDEPFLYEGLIRCDRPVIAAIKGHASGGGLVFGLHADLVVLDQEGLYSANFVKYGFTPGMGASYIFQRRFGAALAAEMFLTGRAMSGAELASRGANVTVVPGERVLATALDLASTVAANPRSVIRALKREFSDQGLDELRRAVAREADLHDRVLGDEAVDLVRQHFAKVEAYSATRPAGPSPQEAVTRRSEVGPTMTAAEIRGMIEAALGEILYLDRNEIDADRSFSELGIDSVGAVEIVRELNRALGTGLDSVTVYDHPTVTDLAAFAMSAWEQAQRLHRSADGGAVVQDEGTASEPPPQDADTPAPGDTAGGPAPRQTAGRISLKPVRRQAGPPTGSHSGPVTGAARAPRPSEPPGPAGPGHIAVIGMSGRFPDAPNLDAYWANLAAGRCSVREVLAERPHLGPAFDPDRRAEGKTYSKWAAVVADPDRFDAAFFNLSPLEAQSMDPQQRLFAEESWTALENAGYATQARRRCGVFVGCCSGDYEQLLTAAGRERTAQAFLGLNSAMLAARIGYLLDLRGPALSVDTACSSSLTAVHLACESIRRGECDLALAGGVALMCTPRMHVWTSKTGMLSPTGRCAPFDAAADGITLGEGVGVVVLKNLQAAVADGDHIYGVILASGMNADGKTNGITAPSADSQAELLRAVYRRAGLSPADIGYLEAHGTGTTLGDPIEVKALHQVFGREVSRRGSCGIGSVKANIGHTTMAAGIAGLLKVLLALKHEQLPPAAYFETINPKIDLTDSPFFVVRELQPWRQGRAGPRIGAVSSFGFSGTNCHVVLSEPPPQPRRSPSRGPVLAPLSARTPAALDRLRTTLADHLCAHPDIDLRDLEYTLCAGREHFRFRAAVVAADAAGLAHALRHDTGPSAAHAGTAPSEKTLHQLARDYLAGGSVDWSSFTAVRPGRRIALPSYPFAADRHWAEPAAIRPGLAGEPDLGDTDLEPDDWRVSGHRLLGVPVLPGAAALDIALTAAARQPGTAGQPGLARVRWLRPVDVRARQRMRVTFTGEADKTAFTLAPAGAPAEPWVRGLVTTEHRSEPAPRVDLAAILARCPRRQPGHDRYADFDAAGLHYGPGFRLIEEVHAGDGEALARLAAPPPGLTGSGLIHPGQLDAALQSLAALAPPGGPGGPLVPFSVEAVDVHGRTAGPAWAHGTRESNGGYSVRLTDDSGQVLVTCRGLTLRPLPDAPPAARDTVFIPEWADSAARSAPDRPRGGRKVAVGYAPGAEALARAVLGQHAGDDADLLPVGDKQLRLAGDRYDVVYLVATGAEPAARPEQDHSTLAGFRLIKALLEAGHGHRPLTLKFVLAGAVGAVRGEPMRPHAAGLLGLASSAAAEYPRWSVGCIDVGTGTGEAMAGRVAAETADERVVALRGDRRLRRVFRPAPAATAGAPGPFRRGGRYLIVGGAGGIGRVLSRHLAATEAAQVAWIGRRQEDDDIRAALAELERLGGAGCYFQADVADAGQLHKAVRFVRERLGRLDGVFHAAFTLHDKTLATLDEAVFLQAQAAKVAGTAALAEAVGDDPLDFIVFFSSAVSFTAAGGQAAYAAASTFQDAYALHLRAAGAPAMVINWGYWGSVGAVAQPRYRDRLAAAGVRSIEPTVGIAALSRVLAAGAGQSLVIEADDQGLAAVGVTVGRDRGAGDRQQALDSSRAAFAALEVVARDLACAALARCGAEAGEPAEALARRLGVREDYLRLFSAVLRIGERAGYRGPAGHGTTGAAQAPDDVLTRFPDLEPHVGLLKRCTDALAEVWSGRRQAVQVLFPGGSADLVEPLYRGQAAADFYHEMLAGRVSEAAERLAGPRPARILEIGAGTGAATGFVLAACAGRAVDYTYTDISAAFLKLGEQQYGQHAIPVTFRLLDVDKAPAGQGFEAGGFDIVIASNVLHATRDIAVTLEHVRSLLGPGGVLVVNEVTRPSDFLTLTFGLTPGWWAFQDAPRRLPDAPLLSPAGWRAALAGAGLADVRIDGIPGTAAADLEQCLLTAHAPGQRADAGQRTRQVRAYLKGIFADVLGLRQAELDERVTFENFGVDSLVGQHIVQRLETDLGELPATLLFEHMSIEKLAGHLLDAYPAQLAAMRPVPAPEQSAGTGGLEPRIIREKEPDHHRPGGIDIAVVGVQGRYPGSPTLGQFWQHLAAGKNCVTEVPPDRWDWRPYFEPARGRPGRAYSRWGGFIDGVDLFDPSFFGILPRDAVAMDPQERLFVETCWTLLAEAGYLGEYTREPRTGVFAGLMYGGYGQLAAVGWAQGRISTASSAYWSVANRVSYLLDLTGPSFAVDSACSSSLTAVHLACESLRRGECRAAIAGGVNLILHPAHDVALCALNMLSADGACKVFDERADGFVPGEGVGAVLLKPLDSALADGDQIWGVIKGSYLNAGGKTGGYTVPNPGAQADLIAEAVRRSGLDPRTIGYVETHGTGTELGDPIEIAGLTKAFTDMGAAPERCAVGSVKANIGHLEGAAGIASLTKVLLQLRHGQLAPCVNLARPNPKIDFAGSPFYPPMALADWPRPEGHPRRAGVSSFGAGGANAHLVVEEFAGQRPARPDGEQDEQLFLLSAKSQAALAAYAARVAAFLAAPGAGPLPDLAWTSQLGRPELPCRLAVLAPGPAELARRLASFGQGAQDPCVWSGVAGPAQADAETDELVAFLLARRQLARLARLWADGARVDWRQLWSGPPRRAFFPAHPFERKRYWLAEAGPQAPAREEPPAATRPLPALPLSPSPSPTACRYLRPGWQPEPLPRPGVAPRTVLVLAADDGAATALRARLEQHHARCVRLIRDDRYARRDQATFSLDPGRPEHARQLAGELAAAGLRPDAFIHWAGDQGAGWDRLLDDFGAFFWITTAVLAPPDQGGGGPNPLRAVFGFGSANGLARPEAAAMPGLLKTLALEHSGFSATAVDWGQLTGTEAAELVVAELEVRTAGTAEIRYRQGTRMRKELTEFQPATTGQELPLREGGTYLITGGAGALGLLFAERLAAQRHVTVVLAGRSPLGEQAQARISALNKRGPGQAVYHRADVADRDQAGQLIATVKAAHGGLNGVLHAAAVTRDTRAVRKTSADIDAVLRPKVFGALALDEATAGEDLDFFVLFSSVAAETGNLGQADYAYANAFLAEFADVRHAMRAAGQRAGMTVAIGWPLWADGGLAVSEGTRRMFARNWSMVPMSTQHGLAAFGYALTGADTRFLVVESPPEQATEGPQEEAAGTSPADEERVEQELRRMAAGFLLVAEEEVDLGADLLDTGFDSVSLTELVDQVNQRYGLDLLPTVLFEHTDLASFGRYLCAAYPGQVRPDTRTGDDAAGTGQAQSPSPAAAPRTQADTADTAVPAVVVGGAASAGSIPVAVIGMAGRMPGCENLEEFWRHLAAGDDLVSAVPADREDLLADPGSRGVRAGFISDVAGFDHGFFGISPREAALMDPQQRLFLETVWSAITDAGYQPAELAGTATGLFAAVSTSDYGDLLRQHDVAVEAHTATGLAHSILANRVSHQYDLHGPSETVDTACSSSLVAVHRAVRAITAGECETAIVGGVNLTLSPALYLAFTDSGMLSPDGRCKTFDAKADGYARGEGVGVVLLKRLADAAAAGDHIYAVIRGSAVNHTGRASSLTAPSPQAQARVLTAAYRAADVHPDTVSYIEAHGTGTALGDPIEVEGLKKAFDELYAERAQPRPGTPRVAIGSVKTNIGHLEAAAGMAGLLKVLLAIARRQLPPSINFDEPHPYLRLAGSPFFVGDRLRDWQPVLDQDSGREVLRAGVSSFGFGGSNAHVVVEDWAASPVPARPASTTGPVLVPLSAPTPQALTGYAGRLAAYLRAHPGVDLARVAYTLQVGREALAERLAVVAASSEDLIRALEAAAAGSESATDPEFGANLYRGTAKAAKTRHRTDEHDLAALAGAWVNGETVAWARRWPQRPLRLPLPAFPFTRTRHWFSQAQGEPVLPENQARPAPQVPPEAPHLAREAILDAHGGNVLTVPAEHVDYELTTDSWAEHAGSVVRDRMRALRDLAGGKPADGTILPPPDWLPFDQVFATASGRRAETLFCRTLPARHGGLVVHNGLFPTWMFGLAEAGFRPRAVPGEYDLDPGSRVFRGDLDTMELDKFLSEQAGVDQVSFICMELSTNSRAGQPVSLTNLEQVRGIATSYGVPLVLDCSRLLENAYFVAEHEDRCRGADVWTVASQLMRLADAVTFSLSKDFGVDFGGLVATRDPGHADRLGAYLTGRGQQISLADRRTIATVLADRDEVARLVRRRMANTGTLWHRLADAGAPVVGPVGGHCVVLDVPAIADQPGQEAALHYLGWIFRHTGIRAAPHLDGSLGAGAGRRVRLAVPSWLSDADLEVIGDRLAVLPAGSA